MPKLTNISLAIVTMALLFLFNQHSKADLMIFKVNSAQECPAGMTIKTKVAKNGLVQFDVLVDAEQVAHADEMYRGRVKANAELKISTGKEQIASVAVQGSSKEKQTWYQFSLSPMAAKSSELQVAVSLLEKDGQPTLGGGVSVQIQLAGFEPSEKVGEVNIKQ